MSNRSVPLFRSALRSSLRPGPSRIPRRQLSTPSVSSRARSSSLTYAVAGTAVVSVLVYTIYTSRSEIHADSDPNSNPKPSSTDLTPVAPEILAKHREKVDDRNAGSITAEELGEHKSRDSLWVAVEGDVWDLTHFVEDHPGGTDVLMQHAGTDVSKLFKAIHPAGTLETHLVDDQKVGRLNQQALERYVHTLDEEEIAIKKARAALFGVDSVQSIDDFEQYAKEVCPTAAWWYYSTGADGEHSLYNNSDAYNRVWFRPRVMVAVTTVDTSAKILGVDSSIPVYVSPTARNGLGQPLGEVAVTMGAGEQGIMQVVSHVASKSFAEVMEAAKEGQPVGYQLYMKADRAKSAESVRNAVELGAHSIWLTVDTVALGKRERERREVALRTPLPHGTPLDRSPPRTYMNHDPGLTWADIGWLKSLAPGLPIVLKGIGRWEDVVLAKQYGADAVVLSNHGGRQLDYAKAPLETLYDLNQNSPETLHQPNFSIFVDGGIRRGTDILKAICLGANGVGLGRPFIWAATGWGPEGVEKAILLLKEEMEIGMRLLGVNRLDELNPDFVDCS